MGVPWWSKFAPIIPLQDQPWLYAFAPKTQAPAAAQLPVAPPPHAVSGSPVEVWQSILAYNNGLSNWETAIPWVDKIKGVVIHKIDEPTAKAVATRLKPSASQYDMPWTVALACVAIESTFDPLCQNGNLGPGESNTANDPLGYDMGICQFKLRYLVGSAPGVTDAATAKDFALDIDKALPYFCSLMATKYLWAQNIVQQNTSSAPDSRFNSFPWLLSTGAYNFGDNGMLAYYESGQFPTHCQHVLDLEAYFAAKLGRQSVFTTSAEGGPVS